MGRKKNAPVVIIRKDKRLNRGGHLLAFALTGGTSAIYTAAKAATNAGYNARTRQLQAAADTDDETAAPAQAEQTAANREYRRRARQSVADAVASAEWRAEHVPASPEYKARH